MILGPILGHLCDVLAKPPQKPNSEVSARLLAKQNIQAFHSRHLSTVCKLFDVQPVDIEAIAPCTPLQQGIISRSLNSGAALYFEEFCFQLSMTTDLRRLKNAWINVVSSTAVLRIRFCPTVDGHAQVVCKNQPVPWYEKGFDNEEELLVFKSESFADWYDSSLELTNRLFEICVLHTPIKRLVYLRLFHALYDGTSLPMILQDVVREYHQTPNMKPRPSFIDALAFGPLQEIEEAGDFWARRFLSLSYSSELRLNESLSSATSFATLKISHLNLHETRRRHNTTYQSLIQAAWVLVLRKFFPSEIIFGMVVSGRSIEYENIDQVIGPLFNTLPFYIDTRNCRSWGDVIGCCHDFNTAVLPYQHSSLRDIMRWCRRSPEQSPFETLFVFQKEPIDNPTTACPIWMLTETAPHADVCSY